MAADPKPARRASKKPRREPTEEFVHYIVEIDDWDWGYSFSLNTERKPIDPCHEFRHLQVRGRLLRPESSRIDRVEVSLLPTLSLEESAQEPGADRARGAPLKGRQDRRQYRHPERRAAADPADADRGTPQVHRDGRRAVPAP